MTKELSSFDDEDLDRACGPGFDAPAMCCIENEHLSNISARCCSQGCQHLLVLFLSELQLGACGLQEEGVFHNQQCSRQSSEATMQLPGVLPPLDGIWIWLVCKTLSHM